MNYYHTRESNQHQSRRRLSTSHEEENHSDFHLNPRGEHSSSSGCSSASPTAYGPRSTSGSFRSQPAPSLARGHGSTGDTDLNSSFSHLRVGDHRLQSYGTGGPTTSHTRSPSSSHRLFASGEIEECDKYNPLVLHHARIQSNTQHREIRPALDKAYSSPREYNAQETHNSTPRVGGPSREPRPGPHRHNLLCNQGLCQMTGKLGVATPKANSAASTTMSIALAHTTLSRSSSSSEVTNHSLSTGSTSFTNDLNALQDSSLATDSSRGPSSRRMSLPEPPPRDPQSARRKSQTVISPPKLLDTIFQRVWSGQPSTGAAGHPTGAPTTEEATAEQARAQAREAAGPSGPVPVIYTSPTTFTGSGPPCRTTPRRNSCADGARRFSERFIHQVTFSLDESHKTGLQAILALRELSNGLTSVALPPAPPVPGRRSAAPTIPIPRISHRYPEQSTTVTVNGQARILNKKTIPSVVIDWSDGVREQFDPTGLTLLEILNRCHYSSSGASADRFLARYS